MPGKHIVFIDDDQEEIRTFCRLYGGKFNVTVIHIDRIRDIVERILQ